jgi:hypothetical protein
MVPHAGQGQKWTQASSGIRSVAWCLQTGQVIVAVSIISREPG